MNKYIAKTMALIFTIAMFVSIGCSSTRAKNSSSDQTTGSSQSTTGSSQSSTDQTASSTANTSTDTLEGCVFKRETDLYLEPATGGAPTKVSSSGKDVSSNVGQHVRLTGSNQASSQGGSQTSSSSGSSTGNMSGSSTGSASAEPEFVVTRVDVVAKECPADVQSRVNQDKKSKK